MNTLKVEIKKVVAMAAARFYWESGRVYSGHSIALPSINEPPDVAGRVDDPAALVNGLCT
jgi:hypothetical protein